MTIFTLAPTLFVVAAGALVLALLLIWLRHREATGRASLVQITLLKAGAVRSALISTWAVALILPAPFFTIPLYLQVVEGFNATNTALRLIPVTAVMLVTSLSAPFLLASRVSPRTTVRLGFLILAAADVWLGFSLEPTINDFSFAAAMAVLGLGIGLMAGQLSSVAHSHADASERVEVGGLEYAAENFGSAIGVALTGSVLLGVLTGLARRGLAADSRVSETVRGQVGTAIETGVPFLSTSQVAEALTRAGISHPEIAALLDTYASAELGGLRIAVFFTAATALVSFFVAKGLPGRRSVPPDSPRTDKGLGQGVEESAS